MIMLLVIVRLQVTYELLQSGDPVGVSCRGQSIGRPSDGQFLYSSSQGLHHSFTYVQIFVKHIFPGRSAVFMIAEGSFSLFPELTTLATTEKKVCNVSL
jgi:hypothetical protein